MVDSHSPRYGTDWTDNHISTPTPPASSSVATHSSDYPDVLDSPLTLHFSATSLPYTPTLYNAPDAVSYSNETDYFHSCLQPASPFPSTASSPFESGAYADAAFPAIDDTSSSASSSSPLPPSPSVSSLPWTSASSVAFFQSPPAADTTSTAGDSARGRQRVPELTREQRAERKRNNHRQIDNKRRHKEIAALATLRTIVTQQPKSDGSGVNGEDWENDDGRVAESEEVQSKAVVLESSIAMIRQLQQMCARMQQACNAKDRQIVSLASDLHHVIEARTSHSDTGLVSATRHVDQLQRSSCLRQLLCISSVLCMTVFAMPLSIIVDCNQAFVECGGWSREQLLHSVIRPPSASRHDAQRNFPARHRVCPLVVSGQRSQKRRQCASSGGSPAAADRDEERYIGQYESSMQQIAALINGTKQKIGGTWRLRTAAGELYEVEITAWREECPPEQQQDWGNGWRPWKMVGAFSMYDRVRVDEEDYGGNGTVMY